MVRDEGRTVATLNLHSFAHFFGERPVSAVGIGGVAVLPEQRGTGAGSFLMAETVRELASAGTALSSLYPATQTFYRRSGYERAGSRVWLSIPCRDIGLAETEPAVRPAEETDAEGIEACYRAYATGTPGHVDRTDFNWQNLRGWGERDVEAYVVDGPDGIEGYVYLERRNRKPFGFDLVLPDMVARTARAGRRLWSFVAGYQAQASQVRFQATLGSSLAALLPEDLYRVLGASTWMLRITDVESALVERGWPAAARADLHLDVRDDVVPANNERFLLEVADGKASVRRGGRGSLRIDVRGLAALYSGELSPRAVRETGRLEGSDDALRHAATLFAGPAPWMTDGF